jgi:hypothetical protein
MAKIIKKIIRILLIILTVLVLVPVISLLLLQTPKLQTFTVRQITENISGKTGVDITIGKVSYTFFRKIVLDDILIKDQNGDTLLAVRQVNLRIRDIRPSEKVYRFGRADLFEPDFRIIKDTTGIVNLSWLINSFNKGQERDTTGRTYLSFPDIGLFDGSFSITDKADTVGLQPSQINFKKLRLSSLNARIRDLIINPDSVSMGLRNLVFTEAGGFTCNSLTTDITVQGDSLCFREVDLITDSSSVIADRILLMPRDSAGWSDFINKVRFDMIFRNTLLNTSDLAYFIRPLSGLGETIHLSGRVSGTVAEMKGRNISIEYAGSTRLRFNFDISGLPSINDSYLHIVFNDLRTSAEDIERFMLPGKKPLELPEVLHDMGEISYKGSFTGFTTDFVSFGTLTTERGSISTDLSLKPDGKNMFTFNGLLNASDIDLAYVTGNSKTFGGLWLHADIDGSMKSFKHLSANIKSVIDSVEINNYLYRNVSLEGTYNDRIWDGSVSFKDRNIRMDILGRFDLAKSMPEIDFTMNLAQSDLHKLNLIKGDTLFKASALITASFRGNKIHNMEGDLRLINSTLENSNGRLNIYDFLISSGKNNGTSLITLKSDFADAEIRGAYSVDAVTTAIKKMLAELFPSRFSLLAPSATADTSSASFTFSVRLKKLDKLNEFFGTEVSIAEGSALTGHFHSGNSEIEADFTSGAISYAGTRLGKMHLKSSFSEGKMISTLTADTLLLPDMSMLNSFIIKAGSHCDTFNLGITWDNHDAGRTFGELKARGFFSLNNKNKPVLTVGVLPTAFTVNSTLWTVSPAHIVVDSTSAFVDNVLLNSNINYIKLNGKLSADSRDKLTLSFEGMNVAYLNNLIKDNKQASDDVTTEMNFAGLMNGNITVSDIYDELLFESNINISDFRVNNNSYGLVTAKSEWDPLKKVAVIDVYNDFEGSRFFDINGTYSPATKSADITASTFRMPMDILNPFVGSFASDVKGVGSGRVRIRGKLKQLVMTGSVMAEDASLKIDFLQTRYSFSDSIRFTPKGIEFRNINFFDERKNQGILNGIVSHKSFKDLGFNFDINMDNMLVLNTKPKDNEDFYGTAYASGYAGIRGNTDKIVFNISAKTEDRTVFYVPLNSTASVSDYPYIIFIDQKKKDEAAVDKQRDVFIKHDEVGKIELNFDLEVTPEAEVRLIMDEKAGDVIRGTGSGKLNIKMNTRGDLTMAGDYVIENGDYLFTLGDIMNKRFSVEEGGTISWNGPIDDAEINIRAIYKTKASLYDIRPMEELKERIPVECQLILSGKLLNPVIKFDIYLPTADDQTREYLKAAINTEEELSRQFLYLLVMNSFYPDPLISAVSSKQTSQNDVLPSNTQGATAIGLTTVEMLSNQLSNWLSQISNDFDIGFNYRPTNPVTAQEVEVALSTQLLNDKVVLNGNVDVAGNQSNTKASTITGDFTIEFKITEKLRFKVFNRSNNNLFYEMPPYTQGFGIFYRRDFDRLKDLFVLPDNRKKKKAVPEEETQKE